jgi:hypothetical protein
MTLGVSQPTPLKEISTPDLQGRMILTGQRTITCYLTMTTQTLDSENEGSPHFPM